MARHATIPTLLKHAGWLCAFLSLTLSTAPAFGLQIQDTFRKMLDQQLQVSENQVTGSVPEPLPLDPINLPPDRRNQTTGQAFPNNSTTPNINSLSLEQLESQAIANHPRLKQLHLEIEALRAESLQQSLPPNPQVGAFGDEIFNGGQGGLYGAFLTETHVPQATLQSRAKAKCAEADSLSAQIAIVHQQIRTDIRTTFYSVLIAQRQNELATQLANSYQSAIDQSQTRLEAGEATRSEVLQLEIQFQQAVTNQTDSNAAFFAAWRKLAAIVGDTSMTAEKVQGDLDQFAQQMDFNSALSDLVQRSPELQLAVTRIQQAQAVLQRERNGALGSTRTQWTVGRDSSTEDVFAGFQVSVPWQKYNQNQGNIAAAEARLRSAHLESEVLARQLTNRLAEEFQKYESAQKRAEIYVNDILPKAQQSMQLVTQAFQGGEAGFLELLTSQRTLITTTNQYLNALKNLWISRQKIEGLLLSDSLGSNNSS